MSDDEELRFETNERNDWTNSNDDDKNDSVSHDDARHYNRLAEPNHNPPQHYAVHIKLEQSRPSDTWPHTCSIISQNVNGLGTLNDKNLETIVSLMIDRKINAYCLQETWKLREYMTIIRGYTVFHHRMKEKPQRQGRTSAGFIIILFPELARAWTRLGKLEPITFPINSKFPGRMIGLTLCFPNKSNRSTDTYYRKAKGVIKLFLCSIYNPHDI